MSEQENQAYLMIEARERERTEAIAAQTSPGLIRSGSQIEEPGHTDK